MNTCGVDHTMGPEEEPATHYNYPARERVRHGLHGRVAYIPARLTSYGVRWEGETLTPLAGEEALGRLADRVAGLAGPT
jgi:hypothetical protein